MDTTTITNSESLTSEECTSESSLSSSWGGIGGCNTDCGVIAVAVIIAIFLLIAVFWGARTWGSDYGNQRYIGAAIIWIILIIILAAAACCGGWIGIIIFIFLIIIICAGCWCGSGSKTDC